jgi:NTE family protein
MVNLLAEQNVARSLTLLRKQDLYLRPELGDISSATSTARSIAASAAQVALGVAPVIRSALALAREYHLWRSRVRQLHPPPP